MCQPFFADLRRKHIFEFGAQINLPVIVIERELDRLVKQIRTAGDLVYGEFEQRTDVPLAQRASQLYMINCIRNMPIKEMVLQLRR